MRRQSMNFNKRVARCLSSRDQGSAILELLVLGFLAQFAILAVALPALQVQRQQLAAVSLSQQVARATSHGQAGAGYLQTLVQLNADSYQLDPSGFQLELVPESPSAGELFTVSVQVQSAHTQTIMRMPR